MIVGIHQPNFMPWIGYFYKMAKSDLFIYLDDVQYTKNSYQNRVKIRTAQVDAWLTLPILHSFGQLTSEVRINQTEKWQVKHLKTLELNYKKAIYFEPVFSLISGVYQSNEWECMSDLNIALIDKLCAYIGIKTKTVKSSEVKVEGSATERLVNLIRAVNGTEYLSGSGGMKYQEEELYSQNGIKLDYSQFKHPEYPQLWGGFSKGLSVVDLLFNCKRENVIELVLNGAS
jgi:hypothetical protein